MNKMKEWNKNGHCMCPTEFNESLGERPLVVFKTTSFCYYLRASNWKPQNRNLQIRPGLDEKRLIVARNQKLTTFTTETIAAQPQLPDSIFFDTPQNVDCARIYKMAREKFESKFPDTITTEELTIEMEFAIVTRMLDLFNEIPPRISLIEVFDTNNNDIQSQTHFSHFDLLMSEVYNEPKYPDQNGKIKAISEKLQLANVILNSEPTPEIIAELKRIKWHLSERAFQLKNDLGVSWFETTRQGEFVWDQNKTLKDFGLMTNQEFQKIKKNR